MIQKISSLTFIALSLVLHFSSPTRAEDKPADPVYRYEKTEIADVTVHLDPAQKTVLGITFKNAQGERYVIPKNPITHKTFYEGDFGQTVQIVEDVFTFTLQGISCTRANHQDQKNNGTVKTKWQDAASEKIISELIRLDRIDPAKASVKTQWRTIQNNHKELADAYAKLLETAKKSKKDSLVSKDVLKTLDGRIQTLAGQMKKMAELVQAGNAIENLPEGFKDPYGKPVNKSSYYWVCLRELSTIPGQIQKFLNQTQLLQKLLES